MQATHRHHDRDLRGDAEQVKLGDLVVAERTFTSDSGKFTLDEQDRQVHLHDTQTYQLDAAILQFLRLFDDWKPLVAALPDITLEEHEVQCYLKAMASGSAVRADRPFDDLIEPGFWYLISHFHEHRQSLKRLLWPCYLLALIFVVLVAHVNIHTWF